MATISITIPDDKASDIRDALCSTYGWTTESGLTKTQFSKKVVAEFVKGVYQNYTIDQAAEQARQNVKVTIANVDIN